MTEMSQSSVESILLELQQGGHIFPEYEFLMEDGHPIRLGSGGFSSVYEMYQKNYPDQKYAMKVIGFASYTVTSMGFQKTLRLQQSLCEESPYIVRMIDTRELFVFVNQDGILQRVADVSSEAKEDEGILVQFELMEKLERILAKDKFRKVEIVRDELKEESEVLRFAKQVGQAIQSAHRNNILHRDIKLENIFWDARSRQYKLGDFGIAKYVESGNAETVVYTDGYGAPEIERRLLDHYNRTADIYSFGITLYLLLNDLKFPGSQGYYAKMVQYDENFTFPAPKNSSEELAAVIRKMCSFYREDRYQSMTEVLAEFNRISDRQELCQDDGELAELATVTFRETQTPRKEHWAEDALSERHRRKEEEKELSARYSRKAVWYFSLLSLLFTLLMTSFSMEVVITQRGIWFALIAAAFVEAILLSIREFYVIAGCIIALAGVGYVIRYGAQLPQLLLILGGVSGNPILSAAAATGGTIWTILEEMDRGDILHFLTEYDTGWMILSVLLITVNRLISLRFHCGKISELQVMIWRCVYVSLGVNMILGGIVLWILSYTRHIHVPELLGKIHLIRTGLVIYIQYAIFEDEASEDTEKDEAVENV